MKAGGTLKDGDPMIEGHKIVDVSHHVDRPNYTMMEDQGVEGVIAKRSQGRRNLDDTFFYHYEESLKRNWLFGAFHYMEYTSTAEEQYEWFTGNLKGVKASILAADMEDAFGQSRARVTAVSLRFLKLLEGYPGLWMGIPWVYTRASWFVPNTFRSKEWAKYFLWIAQYKIDKPSTIPDWGENNWTLWQYAIVPGKPYGVNPYKNHWIDVNTSNPDKPFPTKEEVAAVAVQEPAVIKPVSVSGSIWIDDIEYTIVRKV